MEHERIHSGEKAFICEICNKRFAQAAGLGQHKPKCKKKHRIIE